MSHTKSPNPFFCGHEQTRFVEVINDPNNKLPCGACRLLINGKRLNCTCCGFNLHPFCMTCPQSVSLYVHQHHPLTLSGPPPANLGCYLCLVPIKGMYYTCEINGRQCNFNLHPLCGNLINKYPPVHKPTLDPTHYLEIQHQPNGVRLCDVCRQDCGGWSYRCGVCAVDVHVGCITREPLDRANLDKMYPPVHVPMLDPTHLLELSHLPEGTKICDVCRQDCGGWAYRCGLCAVDAHVECLAFPADKPAGDHRQPAGNRNRDLDLVQGIKLAVNAVRIVNGIGSIFNN